MPTPLQKEFADGLSNAILRICRQVLNEDFTEEHEVLMALGEALILYQELGVLGNVAIVPTATREHIATLMPMCKDILMRASGREAIMKLKVFLEEEME